MSESSSNDVQYVTVVCRVCGTRLDERVAEQPREVDCPDCFTTIQIPSQSEIKTPKKPKLPDHLPTYRLSQSSSPSSRRERQAAEHRRQQLRDGFLVVCPICSARLHPPIRSESYRVRCPDCHEPVRVPSPEEAEEILSRKEKRSRKLPPVEGLPLPRMNRPHRVSTFYAAHQAQIRREPTPRAPNWTFFSQVWSFPWQPTVLKKWLWLTFGFTVISALFGILLMIHDLTGGRGLFVAPFLLLPAIWFSLWTLSYAASAVVIIIEDTAAGNHEIAHWSELGWRYGLHTAISLLLQLGLASLFGYGAGSISAAYGGPFVIPAVLVTWVAFPFLLLSMLETNTWYNPLSVPVARSLIKHPAAWLMFYILWIGLFLFIGGVTYLIAHWIGITMLILMTWIWSAGMLIAARLLGRLAWKVSRDDSRSDPSGAH